MRVQHFGEIGVDSVSPTREQLALPPDAFIFACFNSLYKVLWRCLLLSIPSAVDKLHRSSYAAGCCCVLYVMVMLRRPLLLHAAWTLQVNPYIFAVWVRIMRRVRRRRFAHLPLSSVWPGCVVMASKGWHYHEPHPQLSIISCVVRFVAGSVRSPLAPRDA
jgi:hypothetical protein